MFEKIIIGYIYSPSLGKKLFSYEKELKKVLHWRIYSCFVILFAIFTVYFSNIFYFEKQKTNPPIYENQSNSEIEKTISIISKPEKITNGSKIKFEITAKNISNTPQSTNLKIQVSDILEYAEIKSEGISFDSENIFAHWNEVTLSPSEEAKKEFEVKIKDKIPSFRQDSKNKNSYDCQISTFFGQKINLNLECPKTKIIEKIIKLLQYIDVKNTTSILIFFLIISVIMALRTNLLLKQIYIIRKKEGSYESRN